MTEVVQMSENRMIHDTGVRNMIDDSGNIDLMTLEQVAAFLGFSNSKIYQMVRDNEIPAFKVSRSWRFSRCEVMDWLKKHTSAFSGPDAVYKYDAHSVYVTGGAGSTEDADACSGGKRQDTCMPGMSGDGAGKIKDSVYESEMKKHDEHKNELTVLELMKRTGLFRGISDEALHDFLINNWPEKRLFRKGEPVMFETEKLNRLYIVERGSLAALLDISDVESPAKKYFRHGSMIGLDVMMSDIKTSYMDIWAEEDTFVIMFRVDRMMNYMYGDHAMFMRFATNAMKILSDENIRWMKQTRLLMEKSIREKIIYYLRLEERKSSTPQIRIMDNRKGMASHLGINRSVLSRELVQMKAEGLIDFNRNSFTILEPARAMYGMYDGAPGNKNKYKDRNAGALKEERGTDVPLSLKQIDESCETREEKDIRLEKEKSRFERNINKNEVRRRGRPRGSRAKKGGAV